MPKLFLEGILLIALTFRAQFAVLGLNTHIKALKVTYTVPYLKALSYWCFSFFFFFLL